MLYVPTQEEDESLVINGKIRMCDGSIIEVGLLKAQEMMEERLRTDFYRATQLRYYLERMEKEPDVQPKKDDDGRYEPIPRPIDAESEQPELSKPEPIPEPEPIPTPTNPERRAVRKPKSRPLIRGDVIVRKALCR